MPLNTLGKNEALDGLGAEITHVGIGNMTDPGTGANYAGTEAAGGSYARVAPGWASAASEQKSNSGQLTFEVPAGDWGFFLYFNASSGNSNNFVGYAPINGTTKGFGTVDSAGATADAIQSAAHGLADGNRVQVFNVLGESLPAGLTEGTVYYVVSSATDTFELSTTLGGSSVNLTGQGELYWHKIIPESFGSPGQLVVAANQLVLDARVI
ncbi:hypothetical protein [Herbidospora sp. RD11066]